MEQQFEYQYSPDGKLWKTDGEFDMPPRATNRIHLAGVAEKISPSHKTAKREYSVAQMKKPQVFEEEGLAINTANWKTSGVHFSYVNDVTDSPARHGCFERFGPDRSSIPPTARYVNLLMLYAQISKDGCSVPCDYVLYDARGRSVEMERADDVGQAMCAFGDYPLGPPSRPHYSGMEVAPLLKRNGAIDTSRAGAVVVAIDPYRPAQEAGVKVGDIVVESGGKKIARAGDMYCASQGKSDLVVIRNGKRLRLSITWIPDPFLGLTDKESRHAYHALAETCKPYAHGACNASFIMSKKPVPADFVPTKLQLRIMILGREQQQVKFKITDIPIPDEFWKLARQPSNSRKGT